MQTIELEQSALLQVRLFSGIQSQDTNAISSAEIREDERFRFIEPCQTALSPVLQFPPEPHLPSESQRSIA